MNQGPEAMNIRTRIAGLKRRKRFVHWGKSRHLAAELDEILCDIETSGLDPVAGIGLVVSFYETDDSVFSRCDDSSGYVGDVYRCHAPAVFLSFAAKCEDKARLADLVLDLNRNDDYGVRDSLIHCAARYLPDTEIRRMIASLQDRAGSEPNEWPRMHWLHLVGSLARQVGDARLFEKTRLKTSGRRTTAASIEIADVYLETGDPEAALLWLEGIDPDESFMADERDRLLVEALAQVGRQEDQEAVAWSLFRRSRSKEALGRLLDVLGGDRRDSVLEAEVHSILNDEGLSYSDAAFLAEIGRYDAAADYLAAHAGELNGNFYETLLPLAEAMEATGYPVAASVVYRALIESILKKARSKTYHYAVRYLRKLDLLATQVTDWGPVESHEVFFKHLKDRHGRKTSFWSRYKKLGSG